MQGRRQDDSQWQVRRYTGKVLQTHCGQEAQVDTPVDPLRHLTYGPWAMDPDPDLGPRPHRTPDKTPKIQYENAQIWTTPSDHRLRSAQLRRPGARFRTRLISGPPSSRVAQLITLINSLINTLIS